MIIDPYNWIDLPILAIDNVAYGTIRLTVARPEGYSFQPGQYTLLKAAVNTVASPIRQYSFSSRPDSNHLEFIIRQLPGGSLSSWLHGVAKASDHIAITRPYGSFGKDSSAGRHVFIAGGVGLAPFLSMLRQGADGCSLVYSERQPDSVILSTDIKRLLGNRLRLVISGQQGRLQAADLAPYIDRQAFYYLCGSKQFVDYAATLLTSSLNVPSTHIRREVFTLQ